MLEEMKVELGTERLLTAKEAAAMLRMTDVCLYDNVKNGYIRAIVVQKTKNKKYLFTLKELNRYLNTWTTQNMIVRGEKPNV